MTRVTGALQNNLAYIFAASASVFLYLNSIYCGFVFDDLPAVKNNKDLDQDAPWTNLLWNDFWGTPMSQERSHKSYRPLTVLTFKLNNIIFGREPWSYHSINILLHAAVCTLYLKMCLVMCEICSRHVYTKKEHRDEDLGNSQIFSSQNFPNSQDRNSKLIAYIATALFATHPIHCEAVTGVVGRAELLSALFMILTLVFYAKLNATSLIFSALFCVCAVASKEQGITIVAICVVHDFFIAHKLTPLEFLSFRKSSNIYTGLRTAILSFVACLVLYWRFAVMAGNLPSFTAFDNPASVSKTPTRQFTYNYILTLNAWLLINPSDLLCDWTMGTVPLVSQFSDPRNIATFAFWTTVLLLSWIAASKKEPCAKLILIAISFIIFPFLPASNLFFPVGFVIAERVLYVPSMGFCLLISIGIVNLFSLKKLKKLTFCAFVIILICFSAKTLLRNSQWESEYAIFQHGLQITKTNAKIWNNIGHSLEKEQPELALLYHKQAANIQPDDIGSHMNVGRLQKRFGYFKDAEESYRRAKKLLPKPIPGKRFTARIAPDHLQIFVHLGNLLKINQSRWNEADMIYKEALSMRNDFVDAYINRGEILILLGKYDDAIKCYMDALKRSDKKDDVYFNLGVVHSQIGNVTGAVEYYTYAIQENPNHIKALYNSAVIFEETGKPDLIERAKVRVSRILAIEPENYFALSLLGSIHLDHGEEEKAVSHWKKVLEIHPDDKSALYNMAHMYSKKENQTEECIQLIEILLNFHPSHVKGLMLYGEVLLNKKRDTKAAAEAFRRIVDADPKHVQARHNLCVVILEEGRLTDAEKCMNKVYLIAPEAKYVADNLAIIRRHVAKHRKQMLENEVKFSSSDGSSKKVEQKKSTQTKTIDEDSEEENFVFVEPIRKKPTVVKQTYSERAKTVLNDAKIAAKLVNENGANNKLRDLENALEKVHKAVEKLNSIDQEVTGEYNKKCPNNQPVTKSSDTHLKNEKSKSSKETEDLRKKALDYLDQLEGGLG